MNPFEAPIAAVEDKPRSGNAATAILIGAAIGNGIAYAVLSMSGLLFLWVLTAQGVATNDLYVQAYASTGYLGFAHVLGFVCCMPGGYWCARLSDDSAMKNSLVAGGAISLFALFQNFLPYELPIPYWSRVTSVAVPPVAFILGALWWQNRGTPKA